MELKEYLKENRLITDGAMGTYFQEKYPLENGIVEKWNIDNADMIKKIHLEYIDNGARLIRTNTFACNSMFFENEEELKAQIQSAYQIAKNAVKESNQKVFIAADIGPIYDAFYEESKDIVAEYKFICDIFLECGATIFVFETLSDLNYIEETIHYLKQKKDVFIITQFSFDKSGYTKSGIRMERMVDQAAHNPNIDAYGFNCGVEAAHLYHLLKDIKFPNEKFVTALPNAGYPVALRGKILFKSNNQYFVDMMKKIAELGIDIIGGCCGTIPSYIYQITQTLKNVNKVKKNIGVFEEKRIEKAKHPLETKFQIEKKVYIVELDPPFDTNCSKVIAGADILKKSGVDLITLSDSPMARARMDAGLLAAKIQQEVDIPVMPHICCRDKNVLAIRSLMLGNYMNGIRQYLFVTGDPVSKEFHGKISPVFDFNSISLMKYVTEMNEDLFVNDPVCFSGALNYHGANPDAIIDRMKLKIESGCTFFLTQPVYTKEDVDRIRYIKEKIDTKIICGIMPLVNYKNALFVCNEMPGIYISEEIVDRYGKDMSRDEAEDVAIELSMETAEALKDIADGYYLITPFNRAGLISKIVKKMKELD